MILGNLDSCTIKLTWAVFQEGEEGELKSEKVLTKNSPLLREALGLL